MQGFDVPLTGRRLGEFVIGEKLGEGGFGAVYRAHQPALDRPAVVKILHTRLRAAGAATERFLREARFASRLDHPYAAHIYAFGAEPDGTLWIAMELVRGTPFSEYLRTHGPMPVERLVPLLERICEVVHAAHEAGLVHRDIKPANVMVLSRSGRLLPKLLDFGIAKLTVDGVDAPEPPRASASTSAALSGAIEDTHTAPSPEPGGELDATLPPQAARSSASPRVAVDDRLTLQGATMGSPHYMAPEQWRDAASATARSDLYALAILAYEALTGRPPFVGSMGELAAKHLSGDLPPLPDGLPRALDKVLARALAKEPGDRFESALAMAAAFRVAAGLTAQQRPPPRLDEAVRDRYAAGAVRPIALAVTALDGTTTPRQARDALWVVPGLLARWLAIVALAARSRQGPHHDAPGALAAVREAGTTTPDEAAWLAIAQALARGFATAPELHPVPELVAFLCDASGDDGPGVRRYRELAALRGPLSDPAATDEQLLDDLQHALELLAALLREASFVCDYEVVAPDPSGARARWIGTLRNRRWLVTTTDPADAGVILVDQTAAPVLSLHPLVQVQPPAPGLEPELFVYAGRDARGGTLVAAPLPFEVRDPQVLDWLRVQMAITGDDDHATGEGERPPYRGLAAFTADDADRFFGRERLVDGFVNRLRVDPLLAVVGPSGAGKSSFVHAGVVPALPEWRVVVVRPGAAPLVALASRLARAGITTPEDPDPARFGECLRADAEARGPLLLVVDQFEEVFTLTQLESDRRDLALRLAAAARSPDDPVRVVITLRDDFLVAAEGLPGLRERLGQGLQLLTTPDRDDLLRIVVEPARRAGYEFEDPALPARMVDEVADQPGGLALLSFTASMLWERRDRHFRRLPTRAYDELGGVGGALAQHAESLLESLPAHEQGMVREAFRQLVTAEGTRAVLSRAELVALLGGGAGAEAALERLVGGRLLVSGEADTGADERIELIHEALIGAWPRLVTWRREDAEGARLRDQLRSAARQWDARGRPRGLLWRDEALLEYQLWRPRYPGTLTSVEDAFGDASVAEARRGRRLRRGALALAFFVLAGAALAMSVLYKRSTDERARADAKAAEARARLVESHVEQGRRALLDGDLRLAVEQLWTAREMSGPTPSVDFMLARALGPFEAELGRLRARVDNIFDGDLSPDGELVVLAGEQGMVELWDVAQQARRHVLVLHKGDVNAARFTPDGSTIVTIGSDHVVGLWSPDGALRAALRGHEAPVRALALSVDSRLLATGDAAGGVALWSVADGELVARAHVSTLVMSVAFLGTDRLLAAEKGGTIRVLGSPSLRELAVVARPDGSARPWYRDLDVAPDGSRVVVAAAEAPAELWDLGTRSLIAVLDGESDNQLNAARFSPDGALVASTGTGGIVQIWRGTTGELVTRLRGHGAFVNTLAFSPDGEMIATGGIDGDVRVWHVRSGAQLAAFGGHARPVMRLEFSPRGDTLLSLGWDGYARRWQVATTEVTSVGRLGDGPFDVGNTHLVARAETAAIATPSRIVLVRRHAADRPLALETLWTAEGSERVHCSWFRCAAGMGPSQVWWATDGLVHGKALHGHERIRIPAPGRVIGLHAGEDDRVSLLFDDGALGVIRGGVLTRTASEQPGEVRELSFASGGHAIVAVRANDMVSLWNVSSGRELMIRAPVAMVAATADGWLGEAESSGVGGWGWDGSTRFWRGTDVRLYLVGAAVNDTAPVVAAPAGDADLHWVDPRDGTTSTVQGHRGTIMGLAFSSGGDHLLSAATDGVGIWDWRTGQMIWRNAGIGWITAARFLGDDRILAVRRDGTVLALRQPPLDSNGLSERICEKAGVERVCDPRP